MKALRYTIALPAEQCRIQPKYVKNMAKETKRNKREQNRRCYHLYNDYPAGTGVNNQDRYCRSRL